MHNIPFLSLKFGWYEFQLTCRPWVSHSRRLIWVGTLLFFTLISHRWSDAADLLLYNFNVLSDRKVSITSRRKIRIKKLLECEPNVIRRYIYSITRFILFDQFLWNMVNTQEKKQGMSRVHMDEDTSVCIKMRAGPTYHSPSRVISVIELRIS